MVRLGTPEGSREKLQQDTTPPRLWAPGPQTGPFRTNSAISTAYLQLQKHFRNNRKGLISDKKASYLLLALLQLLLGNSSSISGFLVLFWGSFLPSPSLLKLIPTHPVLCHVPCNLTYLDLHINSKWILGTKAPKDGLFDSSPSFSACNPFLREGPKPPGMYLFVMPHGE